MKAHCLNDGVDLGKVKQLYKNNPAILLELSEEDFLGIVNKSQQFFLARLKAAGARGLVVGLSGGIDSAVVASLAVRALGSAKVYGVLLPSQFTAAEHIQDALLLAKNLGIEVNDYKTVQENFDRIAESIITLGEGAVQDLQKIKLGNIHARLRMIILRDIARARNFLVAGTGNASELLTGYFTLAGDGLGGVDNEVLGRLFKTSVRQLAAYLEVPQNIIQKAPTAGLYESQTDESELGISYEKLDLILLGKLLGFPAEEISQILKFELAEVEKVFELVKRNEYKLKTAPICDFSNRFK